MEPLMAVASVVAAVAAAGGAYHSFSEMRRTRDAEMHLRALLSSEPQLRAELVDELSKRHVGDKKLEDLETRLSYLLMRLPKPEQPRVRAALKQTSRRGQRDYMLKLALDDTATASMNHYAPERR